MIVGTVREIKNEEYRVGLTPEGVRALSSPGIASSSRAGAGRRHRLRATAIIAAAGAEHAADRRHRLERERPSCVKVKEPQPRGVRACCATTRRSSPTCTSPHAGPDARADRSGDHRDRLRDRAARDGALPLLIPMTRSPAGWRRGRRPYLSRPGAGRGKLLSGVPGLPPAHVVDLRRRASSRERAARRRSVLGARVTVFDTRLEQLREVRERWPAASRR